MKRYRYPMNGKSLKLDETRCAGCGICREVCPHGVFGPTPLPGASAREAGQKAAIVDRGACMECGACALNCPRGALSVNRGVGCAAAIIGGFLRGTAPDCGCGCGTDGGCC